MTGRQTYRHPFRALLPQYIRGILGLALSAGPLAFADTTNTVAVILAVGATAFAAYLGHAAHCHASVIDCDENGIAVSGIFVRRIDWTDLGALRLRYFSTRRDGANGWMQLVLKRPGVSIRIESTLTGFKDIVAIAINAAHQKGLDLSPTTLGNLEVLGVDSRNFTSTNGSTCRIS